MSVKNESGQVILATIIPTYEQGGDVFFDVGTFYAAAHRA